MKRIVLILPLALASCMHVSQQVPVAVNTTNGTVVAYAKNSATCFLQGTESIAKMAVTVRTNGGTMGASGISQTADGASFMDSLTRFAEQIAAIAAKNAAK